MAYRLLITLALLVLAVPSASALTVAELRARLATDDPPTLIDVRPRAQYTQGHIPGAINLPAGLLPYKQLPPLGEVVVYGDGIDPEPVRQALAALAGKPGIVPEPLRGGLIAWEGARPARTTRGPGLHRELPAEIDEAQLARLVETEPDLVLVDLRGRNAQRGERRLSATAAAQTQTQTPTPTEIDGADRAHRRVGGAVPIERLDTLTDLGQRFPGAQRFVSGGAGGRGLLGKLDQDRLVVLIDRGDGAAERLARRLRSRGLHRVVILSGGEYALRATGAESAVGESTGGEEGAP